MIKIHVRTPFGDDALHHLIQSTQGRTKPTIAWGKRDDLPDWIQ